MIVVWIIAAQLCIYQASLVKTESNYKHLHYSFSEKHLGTGVYCVAVDSYM